MKIVNFGSCNIDYVYKLDHIVAIGETLHSKSMDTFPGGKGLNQSIAVAKAGATVYHAGFIGNDGALLLDTMRESGVMTDFVKQVDQPNGHAIIQVSEKGENSIFIHTGSNGLFSHEYIDEVLSSFGKGDILILQNEINNIDYIVKTAYEKGMTTVLNPSPIDTELEKLDFNMISYVILNEIEGAYLSGCQEPAKIISMLRKKYPGIKVVLTLGEKGCMYNDGDNLYTNPAYQVKVVDTTAAGDTFMGYFVAGLWEGLDPEANLKRACMASAIAVSKKGAAPSIPVKDEVAALSSALKVCRKENSNDKVLLDTIDRYITENLTDATIKGLADILGYSTVYSGHTIKRITGKTFSDYLQESRCAAAARMLRETNFPISHIISCTGYSNESFFRKKFKSLYGMTPLKYRNAINFKKTVKKGSKHEH